MGRTNRWEQIMDLSIIDQYGLPIAITIAFGYFIWKQQTWIQKELVDDLENQFRRLEGILIKLIDQQKITQMDIKQVKGYMEAANLDSKRIS